MEVVVVEGPDRGTRARVGPSPTSIGRRPDNELVLHDDRASGHHAALRELSGGFAEVADLSSTNGTWIDGERIAAARVIAAGTTIAIGSSRIRLVATSTPQRSQSDQHASTSPPHRPGSSAFEKISLTVAAIGLLLGLAELAAKVWDIGIAPSDVVAEFTERNRTVIVPDAGNVDTDDIKTALDESKTVIESQIDRDPPPSPTGVRLVAIAPEPLGCEAQLAWNPVEAPDLEFYRVILPTGLQHRVDAPITELTFAVDTGSQTVNVVASDGSNDSPPSAIEIVCP